MGGSCASPRPNQEMPGDRRAEGAELGRRALFEPPWTIMSRWPVAGVLRDPPRLSAGDRRTGPLSRRSYCFRLARSPDGFARDDQFDAAILLFASGCGIRRDGLTLAEACRSDGVGRNAPSNEVVADGGRSAFRQRLIQVRGAHTVRMPLDFDVKPRVRHQHAAQPGELLPGARLEICLAGVEEHVREIDDQSSGGLARFENDVELVAETSAKLVLLAFRLCLRVLRLTLCGETRRIGRKPRTFRDGRGAFR